MGSDEQRKKIPSQMLMQTLGLNFVAEELQNNVKESILDSLGVNKMSVDQLVDIAKAYITDEFGIEKIKNLSEEERQSCLDWVGEWFSMLFTTLQNNCDFAEQTLSVVRGLPIFALCDGSFVSLNEETVFFQVDSDATTKRKGISCLFHRSQVERQIHKRLTVPV